MQKHSLKAEKRTILGKKVKNLRKDGLLPANVYGKSIKSEAVQVNIKEFEKVLKAAGETSLVELTIKGEAARPTLIHNIQHDPVDSSPLHADFYQVSLKEKITTKVPVIVMGDAPAVTNKIGVLLTVMDEVEVEALPTDLPERIELDITKLKAIDEELKVKDLKVDTSKLEIKTDPNLTLVKIGALITEEMKKQMEEEAAKAAEAKAAETIPAEGATPVEGEAPKTEGTTPTEVKPETSAKKEEPKKEEKK